MNGFFKIGSRTTASQLTLVVVTLTVAISMAIILFPSIRANQRARLSDETSTNCEILKYSNLEVDPACEEEWSQQEADQSA